MSAVETRAQSLNVKIKHEKVLQHYKSDLIIALEFHGAYVLKEVYGEEVSMNESRTHIALDLYHRLLQDPSSFDYLCRAFDKLIPLAMYAINLPSGFQLLSSHMQTATSSDVFPKFNGFGVSEIHKPLLKEFCVKILEGKVLLTKDTFYSFFTHVEQITALRVREQQGEFEFKLFLIEIVTTRFNDCLCSLLFDKNDVSS